MPDPKPDPTEPVPGNTTSLLTGSVPLPPGVPGTYPPAGAGGYVLVAELGRGGMGVVYRAEDPRLRREVALKILLPQFAADPRAKARFLREARAQAAVEHDHVTPIYQVGEIDGVPFIAMPLLKGMTLAAALRANPRPPLAEVVRIVREIAEGLAAAHGTGLVHRDVKPANVWLEGKKLRVKILDFGLARPADAEAPDADGPLTRTGAIVGTPSYMSPEQASGVAVDARTDLWSLGVVLHQMTTGQLPFRGPTAMAVLAAVVYAAPPPPAELDPSLPPALSDLVVRLLSKNPAGRPPSAEAVAEELRAIEAGLVNAVRVVALESAVPSATAVPDPFAEIDATTANTTARVAGPARSPRWLWPAVGLVAVLGAAAAVWVANTAFRSKKPEQKTAEPEPTPPPSRPVVPTKSKEPKSPQEVPKAKDSPFFSGKDLTGWTVTAPNADTWNVIDGAIVGTNGAGEVGLRQLSNDATYTDFEIAFRVRNDTPAGPEGKGQVRLYFMFRARLNTVISPHVGFSPEDWGSLYLRSLPNEPAVPALAPGRYNAGEFNDVIVRCVGKRVTVTVNGGTVVDGEYELPERGSLAWQIGGISPGRVTIKDIRFTDLSKSPPEPPFFNGKDLTGWKVRGSSPGAWTVADGAMVCTDPDRGVGVATERTYSDFVLSFQARCAGAAVPDLLTLRFRTTIRDNPPVVAGPMLNLGPSDWGTVEYRGTRTTRPVGTDGLYKAGEFNAVTLRCVGKRVTVTVNGGTVVDEELNIPAGGVIAWGLQGGKARNATIKDIRFTDLSTDPDRRAAELLLPHMEQLVLEFPDGKTVTARPGDPLPSGPFALTEIVTRSWRERLPATFAGEVFLPAVAELRSLRVVRPSAGLNIPMTEDELARLADLPAGQTITTLQAEFDLTLKNATTLARMPRLRRLFCNGPTADDAALEKLKELPAIRHLVLSSVGQEGTVTPKGLEALTKLPLHQLSIGDCPVADRAYFKLVAGMPDLGTFGVNGPGVTDDAVGELVACPKLGDVMFHDSPVTDTGLASLAKIPALRSVIVTKTKVTEAGVKKLAAALPRCRVEWDGGVIEPTKKP